MGGGADGQGVGDRIDEARDWLREAGAVTVLTGAGVSTDSGIPDFRGPKGLWTQNPEAERLATIGVYLSDPDARRRAWQWRRSHPAWDAEPNAAHRALVDLERSGRLHTLVTQNVDGLHQAAGSDPDRVVEVHGSMREVVCVDCDHAEPTRDVFVRVEAGEEDPACPACGGILKTATIFFGQALDPRDIERAEEAARECDLFLAAGTSLQVYPVAFLPEIAKSAGARLVIVNGEPTPFDDLADAAIHGGVGDILPVLLAEL